MVEHRYLLCDVTAPCTGAHSINLCARADHYPNLTLLNYIFAPRVPVIDLHRMGYNGI